MENLPPPLLSEYLRILAANGLGLDFPDDVRDEVAAILADPGIDDPSLEDLTSLPFVTIDNPDSRDLDQALQVEREGSGFLVRYALADGAWFIRPGRSLWAETLRRGTSQYLPGLVVPMLPRELSEGIVSLNPGVDRRALVFSVHLDAEGRALQTELRRARVHSQAKLSYEGVQAWHDDPSSHPYGGQPYTETLELLRVVGELRMAEARSRHVVDRNGDERLVELEGEALVVRYVRRNDVSRWNEQISLLCNMEGGRILKEAGSSPVVQAVFRVHEPPTPQDLLHLERVIHAVLRAQGLDHDRYAWHAGAQEGASTEESFREPLADYLDRLREAGIDERILEVIEHQTLVINRASTYATVPGLHHALGVRPYCRFTAPMREVVGIFTHKEAIERFGLGGTTGEITTDEALRDAVIASANGARNRERQIDKAVLRMAMDAFLSKELDLPEEERPTRVGTVMAFTPTRLYVRMDDPPFESKVYADDVSEVLGGEPRLDDDEVAMNGPLGRIAMGDALSLRVRDCVADRWRFRVARV